MTLLWVTEHFVMRRLIETMKTYVSIVAHKPLLIGEIMSNNDITQFCHFYWKTNGKKADEKATLFHDGICLDCDIA